MPCGVWLGGSGDYASHEFGFNLPGLAFWLAGVVEAIANTTGVVDACKKVGRVTGRWLLGVFGIQVLVIVAHI